MADKPISEVIRERLKEAHHRFHANDNIADFLKEGELEQLQDEVQEKFESVLDSLLIDRETDPNSNETGLRLSKMYLKEIMSGRYLRPPKVTAFPNEKVNPQGPNGDDHRPAQSHQGMLVVPAELNSVCSHHHQAVSGICYIGIIPGEHVIGLSKYVRVAQFLARRGTLQEQLTVDILRAIQKAAKTINVAVVNISTHGCVTCRGVEAGFAQTSTAELGGLFGLSGDTRKEFYQHVQMLENKRNTKG